MITYVPYKNADAVKILLDPKHAAVFPRSRWIYALLYH